MLSILVLALLTIVNVAISSSFSPTWDFPEHLASGLIRLGMMEKPADYRYLPYGVFSDALPVLFSRIFPASWFPASYLLYGVIIGCLGVIFFYLLIKDGFGEKTALLSAAAVFLLPRFVGHLHTNIKDVVTTSFLIITVYFFHKYLCHSAPYVIPAPACRRGRKAGILRSPIRLASLNLRRSGSGMTGKNFNIGSTIPRWIDALLAVLFYTFAVNTKITVLQLYPLFIIWMGYEYLINSKIRNKVKSSYVTTHISRHTSLKKYCHREPAGAAIPTGLSRLSGIPPDGGDFVVETPRNDMSCVRKFESLKTVISVLFLLSLLLFPLIIWFLLWPGTIGSFFEAISYVNATISLLPSSPFYYAFKQLVTTTPLPILLFVPFGLYVLFSDTIKHLEGGRQVPTLAGRAMTPSRCKESENHSLSFFFLMLFIYTLVKYPLFNQPVIDDVRYFLEIYFPLSLAFVLGVEWIGRKYGGKYTSEVTLTKSGAPRTVEGSENALRHLEGGRLSLRSHDSFEVEEISKRSLVNRLIVIYLGIFLYLTYLFIVYHPYQITYYNALATRQDPDFWGASYREAIGYVNQKAGKGATVSALLARGLAGYYLGDDLRKNFNTKTPEESDVVVILNRSSVFMQFGVSDFYGTHTPSKVIVNRLGTPLSFIYFNQKK